MTRWSAGSAAPRPAAGGSPPCAREPSSAPRRACSTGAGSPRTGPAPRSCAPPIPDPDPIYIRDGKVWSSAGVTAGIDLSLALVHDDLGVDVAQTIARWLVMFLHRPGGQTQFASPVWVPRAERSAVRAVQDLVEAAPGGDHRLPILAAAAAMSVRHFTRVFTAEVGESPSRFVERTRVEAARRELETTNDTLDVLAARCGLGSAETLRRVVQRHLGVAPDAYRRRFRTSAVSTERTSA
ncbi:MAG TPA: helix-turn-helix domain-containing protein [Acidimicrobiales bacterium]|jgi:transcriptional regulator GlxA family with amidase domain